MDDQTFDDQLERLVLIIHHISIYHIDKPELFEAAVSLRTAAENLRKQLKNFRAVLDTELTPPAGNREAFRGRRS